MSCKKEVGPTPEPEPVDTKEQLIRDSIYYYYNQQSLWTEYIPDNTVLRTFTASYTSNDEVLRALKARTPYYAGYNGSIDRFSFIEEKGSGSQQRSSNGLRMDTNDGYGMYFGWRIISETLAAPVLYFVEGGSPAQKAGITRGSMLLSLNDATDVTAPYNCNASGACYVETNAFNDFQNKLNTATNGNTMRLKVRTVDGQEIERTLTNGTYVIDPLLADTVYNYNKKIGYFAFSSFEEVTGNNQNYQNFQRVFQRFEAENIKELIVDMRYNTGGYVHTAQYLANKVVPASGDGNRMFTYEVNTNLQPYTVRAFDGLDFRPVNFVRNNNLELETVYFLVTEETASASELLINVLKPYMRVVLIAETTRTYGKPVGFFAQDIMNEEISLWVTSFKTVNSRGDTDYWDGLSVDETNVADDIGRDFGDPAENMIARAISLSGGNSSARLSKSSVSRSATSAGSLPKKFKVVNKPDEKNLLKKRN
ncbi:S41 family peptidase [Sphingobacterium griseoflavum]|uniref:Tail specific protease domain-containing protein n=1 Tax=Sphingobacterium griseoflavum TaxID=1474952 RepID=A0ABQ3HXG3_9SPHI|nr:S41 family peptidase [Sphingobacterium griseoflavum]GHE41288.1 hypothetical protein GCM10017764_25770 [Sphingobacterium griseoflavum]